MTTNVRKKSLKNIIEVFSVIALLSKSEMLILDSGHVTHIHFHAQDNYIEKQVGTTPCNFTEVTDGENKWHLYDEKYPQGTTRSCQKKPQKKERKNNCE